MLRSLLSSTTRNGRGSTPAKRDVSAPSSTTRCGQSSTWARRPYPGWPRNRSSTSCSWWPIPATNRPTCRRWRRPGTCCGSASRTGSSTASSKARIPTSTCTFSATALRRSSACCSSATGYAKTMPTATTTNAPSGSWPAATGGTFSTTPTPRPRWSRRSWSAPRPRRERPDKQSRGGASRVGGVDGPADAMRGEEVQELGRVVPLVGGEGGTQPGAQLSLGEALDAAGAYMARNHDDLGQRELHDRGRLGVAGKGDCRASCRRSSAPVAVLPDEAAVLEGLHGFEHGAQGAAGGPAAIYGVRGGDLGDGLD